MISIVPTSENLRKNTCINLSYCAYCSVARVPIRFAGLAHAELPRSRFDATTHHETIAWLEYVQGTGHVRIGGDAHENGNINFD